MNLATTGVVRLLVTVLAIAAIAGQVAHIDALSGTALGLSDTLAHNPRPSFLTLVVANAVVSTVAGILGMALVFRGDRGRGATGLGIAFVAWSYLLAYSGIIVLMRPDPGLLRSVFAGHFPVVEALGLAGLIHFTSVFPARLGATSLAAPASLPRGLRALQKLRITLLSPAGPWIAVGIVIALVLGLNSLWGRSVSDAGLNPLMDVFTFSAVGLVVLNLRRSWTLSSTHDRARMWWAVIGLELLVGALALLIGGNILLTATGWPEPAIAWRPILLDLGFIGLLIGTTMSVVYNGDIDAEGLGRRVSANLVLAMVVLVAATGVEVLFSSALVGRISLPAGLGTVIAALTAAVTYGRSMPFISRVLAQVPGLEEDRVDAS